MSQSPAESQSSSTSEPSRRRPIPRKGHKKSRAGCVTCKRRKVKCDEVSPACGPCSRLGLECKYTGPQTQLAVVATPTPSPSPSPSPSSSTFGMTDLRFFQHFLTNAYPPLPVGGRSVWQYISQMSHEYDFLVHAMLGLGASHLGLLTPSDFNPSALQHRITSIKHLNDFLCRSDLSQADREAAFATILALTFQAAHMPDGLQDFLTMSRGCFLVGTFIVSDMASSAFRTFVRDAYVEKAVRNAVYSDKPLPLLDEAVAHGFCTSMAGLAPFCNSVVEVELLAMMRNAATSATTDLYESFRLHSHVQEKYGEMASPEFAVFIRPDNHAARLLIMHILLLDTIMSGSICLWEDDAPLDKPRDRYDGRNVMAVLWQERIYADLPDTYKPYAEWAVGMARQLRRDFSTDSTFWRLGPEMPPLLQLDTAEGAIISGLQ